MSKTQIPSEEAFRKFIHDLKTPLSVMRMNLDLFELSEEYKLGEKKASDTVKMMNKQIDALLLILSEFEK